MNKRLFVGSLPYDVTEDQLSELFTPYGQVVSTKLIMDRETGRSKGFGFVEYATETEAQEAVERMNGAAVGRRQIVVNEARPLENRAVAGARRGGYGDRW